MAKDTNNGANLGFESELWRAADARWAYLKAQVKQPTIGQESNYTTWRLAKMNLAIRGIEGQIAHGDTFHNDRFPDLKADFILANPPFNVSDWGGERLREDKRWQYAMPPVTNRSTPQVGVM